MIIFLIASSLAFLIPGLNYLRPLKKRPIFEKVVLGTTIGITIWTAQAYIFGLLGVRWFSYLYLALNLWLFLFLNKNSLFRFPRLRIRFDYLNILIVIFGVVLNLSAVWFIGTRDSSGLYFCCRGVPDAIYHLSLTHELSHNFPPYEPGMSDTLVKNYHYLSNLATAELSRVFYLDYIKVQFQYMNLLIALLLGSTAFVLAGILKLSKNYGRLLAIFLYASGDILYLLLYFRGKGLNFNTTIIDDASKLLAGPPRAFSILILMAVICLFCLWIRKRSLYVGVLMSIMAGLLVGFKVYTGIFAISGLGVVGIYYLFKRNFKMLLPLVVALLIALSYYLPNNSSAGGLHFNGLWRFENYMQHKELGISKLDNLRIESVHKGQYFQAATLEVLFIVLYFSFLFGTVNLGLIQTKKSLSLFPKELNIFLISAIFVSLAAGSFFYQTTGGANTVQFLITVFIMGALYSSLAIYYWIRKFPLAIKVIVLLIVLVLTTSRSVHEGAMNFISLNKGEGIRVDNARLAAFDFIKNSTPEDAIIAVEPWMAEDQPFMYVPFLTNRKMFLSGAGTLRDHGHDTKSREKVVAKIFTSDTADPAEKELRASPIDYLYVTRSNALKFEGAPFLRKVFENDNAIVYQII